MGATSSDRNFTLIIAGTSRFSRESDDDRLPGRPLHQQPGLQYQQHGIRAGHHPKNQREFHDKRVLDRRPDGNLHPQRGVPLNLDIVQTVPSNGGINQTTTSFQTYNVQSSTKQSGAPPYRDLLTNTVSTTDTQQFNSSGNFTGNTGQTSAQLYNNIDNRGVFQFCFLTAANNALTSFTRSCDQGSSGGSANTTTGSGNPRMFHNHFPFPPIDF